MTQDQNKAAIIAADARRQQAEAVRLLSMRAPPTHVVQMLQSLPTNGCRWLWTENDDQGADSVPTLGSFCDAVEKLARLPRPTEANAVAELLECLGHSWRRLRPSDLNQMLRVLGQTQSPTHLMKLEIRHVARWILALDAENLDRPEFEWPEMIVRALAWMPEDEISLRRDPRQWVHPLEAIVSAGFVLEPIVRSDQLADAVAHQRPICSCATELACVRGDEAWWFVRPVYSPTSSSANADSVIGLRRIQGGGWMIGNVFAHPDSEQAMNVLASCLATQAQTAVHLANACRLAQTLRLSADSQGSLAQTMRAAFGREPSAVD